MLLSRVHEFALAALPEIATDHFLGRTLHVPDKTNLLHTPEDVPAHIDLPPAESLPSRPGVIVMVIMPSFPHRQQRNEHAIPTFIISLVDPAADEVRHGVDEKGAMKEQNGTHETSPDECVEPHGGVDHNTEEHKGKNPKPVEEPQLPVLREVTDILRRRANIVIRENPANM